MFKARIAGIEKLVPVIFPNELVHQLVERYFRLALQRHWPDSTIEAVSAGDCELGFLECSGKSETLGLSSDPEDAEMIRLYDYLHGM